MAEIKLFCGFCTHIDTYEKNKFVGGGKKSSGSSTIKCSKCGRNLNQKNVVEK